MYATIKTIDKLIPELLFDEDREVLQTVVGHFAKAALSFDQTTSSKRFFIKTLHTQCTAQPDHHQLATHSTWCSSLHTSILSVQMILRSKARTTVPPKPAAPLVKKKATLTISIVEAIKLICHEKIQLNLAVWAVEPVKLV